MHPRLWRIKGARDKGGKGRRECAGSISFSPRVLVLCCGGDVAVTREMLTGLYFGITIPGAGRQIAGDKAAPDGGTRERGIKNEPAPVLPA